MSDLEKLRNLLSIKIALLENSNFRKDTWTKGKLSGLREALVLIADLKEGELNGTGIDQQEKSCRSL